MAAEGKIHSRMATADANLLAGATSNGQGTKDDVQEPAEEDRSERLKVAAAVEERTRDEL